MKHPNLLALGLMSVVLPATADLVPFGTDFESYAEVGPGGFLENDWLVFGNEFTSSGGYIGGYGPNPAPNNGQAFCNIATGEGGPDQGTKVLTVYSDYNNAGMAPPPTGSSKVVEANTYQEFVIGAADEGATWTFRFDVKKGNLELRSTNRAFIKVLDPGNGYSMTEFLTFDVATLTDPNWATRSLEIVIGAWGGQILQIGFMATATEYEGSGAFYDNISFTSPDYVAPSGPRIVSMEKTPFGEFIVEFETRSGYEYSFLKALSPAGPYEEIDFGLSGDDTVQSFTDANATESRAFYKIDEQESP